MPAGTAARANASAAPRPSVSSSSFSTRETCAAVSGWLTPSVSPATPSMRATSPEAPAFLAYPAASTGSRVQKPPRRFSAPRTPPRCSASRMTPPIAGTNGSTPSMFSPAPAQSPRAASRPASARLARSPAGVGDKPANSTAFQPLASLVSVGAYPPPRACTLSRVRCQRLPIRGSILPSASRDSMPARTSAGTGATAYWVTADARTIGVTMHMPPAAQRREIEGAGRRPISSCIRTDFVKDRVAVEA